ncbi:hypothetical protein ABT248_15510 [Streptomyces sp. NPDC000971]|uniref:hypothetical protein n=1 Tax=Streptomyces sp. NPDC000971 TaxID=3156647 RepID=UPI00331D5199
MKAAALAALLTLTTGPTAAADHPTTVNSAPTLAATPAPLQTPAQPVDPTVTTPPASPPPAGTDAQAPVTVTQPPGVSGFIPIQYLLPLLLALLIAFLAGRPGGQEAAKNLLRLLRIGGGGGSLRPPCNGSDMRSASEPQASHALPQCPASRGLISPAVIV